MNDQLRRSHLWDWLLFFVGRRKRVIVDGRSMLPTFQPNDQLIYAPYHVPAVGDIVVAQSPDDLSLKLIKRVIVIRSVGKNEGTVYLRGDNQGESTDYAAVPFENILGVVVSRF